MIMSIPQLAGIRDNLRAGLSGRVKQTGLKGEIMAAEIPKNFRTVIIAASVGNVIEWYDFYIFGSLAAVLSVKFFDNPSQSQLC